MTLNRLSLEMDIKDSASESSEASEEHHRENLNLLQEFLNHHEQTVSRSMDTKSTASQKEVRNMLLKISGRGNASYILAKRLAKLCPVGMWKAELVNDESGHLSRRFDKCCVEGMTWFILGNHSKMQGGEREIEERA